MSAVSDFEKPPLSTTYCNVKGCSTSHDNATLLCMVALIVVFALFGNA